MLPVLKCGSSLESRILLNSYSVSPSNSIGGGGLFSVWEGVQEGGFELGDVENRVDPSELLQEADCNRVHAQGAYYLEQSQVLLCQFPQRLGCAEELHFYIYMVANPEGW